MDLIQAGGEGNLIFLNGDPLFAIVISDNLNKKFNELSEIYNCYRLDKC
jgi:hypothetical protein